MRDDLVVPAAWVRSVDEPVVTLPAGPRLLARVWSNVWQMWLTQDGRTWTTSAEHAGWLDLAYAAHLARTAGTVGREGADVPAVAVMVDWKLGPLGG